MSETALTLIKSSMRVLGILASGETPSADETNDALEAMKMMFRTWSANDLNIFFLTTETLIMNGSTSYTIGPGGNLDTVRPTSIRGAFTRDIYGNDLPVRLIDADKYRLLILKAYSSICEYLWYNPEYPLGKLYPFPTGGSELHLDTLKPLSDPSAITDSIVFPPEYCEPIKWGLACRIGPEYGKDPSDLIKSMAADSLRLLQSKNFASQVAEVRPEIIKMAYKYNINQGR